MAGSTVKIGVDVTQFKQGMQQAQQSAKTLQAQMKANEAQFKATGNQEQYLTNKSKLLKQQLEAQKTAAKNAEQALKAMGDDVDKNSKEYQQLERALAGANAAMYETQAAMNAVAASEMQAAGGAGNLEKSLSNISTKVSLDQVINGIGKITSGLETAAAKAVELGKSIWDNIMDSAEYADDISTLATKMGLTTDELQRMIYVADRFEAPAEQMAKTWKKVKMSMTSDSGEVQEAFEKLGLAGTRMVDTGFGMREETWRKAGNYKDMFWEIGDALMRYGDEEEKERIAQKLLGRSWEEMIPLFKAGRQAYEEALEAAPVATEEAVEQAASLNDRMKELETQWQTMKLEVIGAIAPALEKAADALGNLLQRITEYLQTDKGQEKLKKMEEAVSALFDDLANIDPEKVVVNFASVFEGIVSSFQWISDHWEEVKTGLKGIAIGFGALKVAQIGLNIANLVSGISGLAAGAGASAATSAATSTATAAAAGAGTSLLTKGWSVLKVAGPIGAFLGTLLTPAETDAGEATPYDRQLDALYDQRDEYENKVKEKLGEDTYNKIFGTKAEDGSMLRYADTAYKIEELYDSGKTIDEAVEELKRLGVQKGRLPAPVPYMSEEERERNKAPYVLHTYDDGPLPPPEEDKYQLTDELSQAIEEYYDLLKLPQTGENVQAMVDQYDRLAELLDGDEDLVDSIQEKLKEIILNGNNEGNLLDDLPDDWYAELPLEPELKDDSASEIQKQLRAMGVFSVVVKPAMAGGADGFAANGLWSVPFDGYHAILHRGERVVPAREVQSRSYNSNLYVESMIMNNGTDAEGLAAAMAAAQRRTMSGYGS